MSNGNYLSGFERMWERLPEVLYKSFDSTMSAYVRANLNFVSDLKAAGTRGGAIDGSKFAFEEKSSVTYDIYFDDYGGIYRKAKDKDGNVGLVPVTDINGILDKSFSAAGGIDLFTGGIYGGEPGDQQIYKDSMEDWTHVTSVIIDSTLNYYREKATPITVAGKTLYKASIPVSESPFEFLDVGNYDPGLIVRSYDIGTAYELLNPFFQIPKDVFLSFSKKMKGKIPLDPIINTQMEMAKYIGEGAGGSLASMVPALWIMQGPIKDLRSIVTDTIENGVNEIVGSAEGLLNGYYGTDEFFDGY